MKRILFITCITLLLCSFSVSAGDITGKVKAKGAKNAGNTIIYIDKIDGKIFPAPTEPLLMDQKDITFYPHVLPILKGSTVDFLNSDDVLHNVFTPDGCAGKFNLGSWPKGEKKSYKFEEECVSVMLCNVHPEMEAWVVSLETPYFTVTDKKGNYTIKDVPPGKYTLKVWHKKLSADEVEITVPKSANVNQDFTIKK